MYGNNPQRTFATSCASDITSKTVARLVPAWVFDTPRPVTASPSVVGGVVYIGAWDGVMYALDASDGPSPLEIPDARRARRHLRPDRVERGASATSRALRAPKRA